MSAAATLPYVCAVEAKHGPRRIYTKKLNNGCAFYRGRTERLLRRFLHASLAVGHVPSVMEGGGQRTRATCSRRKNFEDVVIFAIDIERCLRRLDPHLLQVVVKIAIQDYLMHDVAQQMGLDVRTVTRSYRIGLDQLTEILLDKGLLEPRSLS